MKTIVEGKANIRKLLSKQHVKNTRYRLMKYLLRAECDEGILLHNVITGQLVLLTSEEARMLDVFPTAPQSEMISLIEDYFLVPVEFDEKEFVQKLRIILKSVFYSKDIRHYTILTTTNCNARCFYCFQECYPHINMDRETADQLVEYMIKHCGNSPLSLAWFGGEPLVCVERIYQICDGLHNHNIDFQSTMISNGYLFTEKLVDDAVNEWNLRRIQITLDGTEQVYKKTKAFVSVRDNPYIRVMNNIDLLLTKKVHVNIRLNLGQHNMDDLQTLIEELNTRFSDHEYLKIYVQVLFEHDGFNHSNDDLHSLPILYQQQHILNNYLEELGLLKQERDLPSIRYHKCMADNNGAVAVYPDGKLFKCEHTAIGDDFGSIKNEFVNNSVVNKFIETYETSSCSICPIYPHCILLKKCITASDEIRLIICKQEIERMKRLMIRKYTLSY